MGHDISYTLILLSGWNALILLVSCAWFPLHSARCIVNLDLYSRGSLFTIVLYNGLYIILGYLEEHDR